MESYERQTEHTEVLENRSVASLVQLGDTESSITA